MIYAMSDIHGCYKALEERMKLVDLSGENRIIFLGDYLDYGPQSGQVLRYIFNLQKKHGKEKVVVLKGNHEAMFLEWIDEYKRELTPLMEQMAYDSWLKTDSEHRYNVFRTLVTEDQFKELTEVEKTASFAKINTTAVKMVLETSGDLVRWMRSMENYFKTGEQIFVHAGVDEEAEDLWEWGTEENIFLWKFPASLGRFCRTIIAGHVGTCSIAKDRAYHEIYFDGKSHYYIDGSVYKHGKLLLLKYDEGSGKYYQVEKHGEFEIRQNWRSESE